MAKCPKCCETLVWTDTLVSCPNCGFMSRDLSFMVVKKNEDDM